MSGGEGGGDGFSLKIPGRGGVSRRGGGGGRVAGRVFERDCGGRGLNTFFSGPKFPPRYGLPNINCS